MHLKTILIVASSLIVLISCSENSTESGAVLVGQGLGPRLTTSADGDVLLSYIESAETVDTLAYLEVTPEGLGPKRIAASGENWFVNWADFPSVIALPDNKLAAHWLARQPAGGYAYDVVAAFSTDNGNTWGKPFRLHDDGTATEHGFVTLYADNDYLGAVWLDGRNMSDAGGHGDHGSGGMTLRAGLFLPNGSAEKQHVVDGLTCDCCQTDVAITSDGPVAIYRNRSDEEVRDIYISRNVEGSWLPGTPVFDDGWNIAGCPVSGPTIEAVDKSVAVTWFTGASGTSMVKAAWSDDGGQTFRPPVILDDEKPLGYVGSTMLDESSIVSSWVCRRPNSKHAICYRRVEAGGGMGITQILKQSNMVDRMSVPQVTSLNGKLIFVWTEQDSDRPRIMMARVSESSL